MRSALAVCTLLLVAVASLAADDAKPNQLTAKDVADGWLLLFDGETTFGWKIDGEASVKGGALVLGGDKETTAVLTTSFGECLATLEWHLEKGNTTLGWSDSATKVELAKYNEEKEPGWCTFSLQVGAERTGFRIASQTGKLEGYVKNGLYGAKDDPTRFSLKVPAGSKILLRNIKLQPAHLESIFNGKDLAGWKEFAGKKTKFSVTKDGLLNLKEGPGDLQTQKAYDNFILQVDCFTNGKNLNSGVFFRCRPDEYQQGYEAQIHNGFTAEPTKEYTIEEYDAQTHELRGSKKEKYTAMDYGTGAIYRRIPARKQVAKDEEWFTMTVAAQERHIAVWVNGIQVTDWVDNRPIKDNARNGCRLEKGPISLQGHDPTTDLNFRNIRIAETPKGEKKE